MSQTPPHIDCEVIIQDIIRRYEAYGERGEAVKIQAAHDYAQKAHTGIFRKS